MASDTIRHDSFYAGISQDDRLQQKGEYTYGRDINIRQGQFIELEKKPESLTSVSESWTIVCEFKFNGIFFLGCSDGGMRITDDFITYELKYTNENGRAALGMVGTTESSLPDGTLFWWTDSEMYYCEGYGDDQLVWGPNTHKVTSGINATSYRQSIHYTSNIIFFTNGNVMSYVTTAAPGTVANYGSYTSGLGAFQTRSELIGITNHANSFWAYDVDGRMYVIDQSISAVSSIKYFKEPIIGVYNNSDYDLVITSSGPYYKAMYINLGVGPNSHTLLRRYLYSQYNYLVNNGTAVSDGIRFNFTMKQSLDNSFAENSGIVYFTALEGGENIIYSYGRKNNALPSSLSILTSKRSDGSSWGEISSIWSSDGYIYIAGNSDVTRYVERIQLEDNVENAKYQSSGYIVTRVDTLGIYEQPKNIGGSRLGSKIPTGTSIEVSYSMDERNFTLIQAIGPNQVLGGILTAALIERNIPTTSFNEIAIKLELKTTDESVTPRLFSLEYLPQTALSKKPQ